MLSFRFGATELRRSLVLLPFGPGLRASTVFRRRRTAPVWPASEVVRRSPIPGAPALRPWCFPVDCGGCGRGGYSGAGEFFRVVLLAGGFLRCGGASRVQLPRNRPINFGFAVTSGWSNLNMGNRSLRSIRNKSPQPLIPVLWQSYLKTLRHSNKVSSGKSLMYKKDGSWGSSTVYARNNSPQCPRLGQTSSNMVKGSRNMGSHRNHFEECIFDICRNENKGVQLKKPLFEQNREKIMELEQKKFVTQPMHLRPGMILLKNHISHEDQVSIIKYCRESGISEGGFYRPGYSSGSKLHLQMTCLGQDWDLETRKYDIKRRIDGATPPPIPDNFRKLVDGAMQAGQVFLWEKYPADKLPSMSPETCIVNFYSNSGKLGLHQDRDESIDSIRKGVPIVSFSVGDSAEFLYGVKRDVDMADKIVLESGDVLIFGGKSRSIFHGVSSIFPNTAPKRLIEESKLKPGRLNLTFRQL